MELEELNESARIRIRHYLILDDKFTWWQCGRSYLCRRDRHDAHGICGYEVLFGREVADRLPKVSSR